MTTPKQPRSDAPRLRARARAGTSDALRPEVAAAIDGLERSIGEVAAREQTLAVTPPNPAAPPASAGLVLHARVTPIGDDRGPHVAAAADAGGLELGLAATAADRRAAMDAAPEPDLDLGPLLAKAGVEGDDASPSASRPPIATGAGTPAWPGPAAVGTVGSSAGPAP